MKKHKYEASYTEHNYENWLVYLHFESDNDTQAKRYATIWAQGYHRGSESNLPYLDKNWRINGDEQWCKHYYGSWDKESDDFSLKEGWLFLHRVKRRKM